MKTTLPKKSKSHEAEIHRIRDIIVTGHCDKVAFVILFGSFARGNWVYDYHTKDGTDYEYASDYDFLVLTKKSKNGRGYQATRLENEISKRIGNLRSPHKRHNPYIMVESLDKMNRELRKGQYFFSDIKKEGICLYQADGSELAEAKELTSKEIKEIAKNDFEQWFDNAEGFLIDFKNALEREDYKKAAFYLHQATECFLNCSLLVLTGYKPKLHNIEELLKKCSSQSHEFLQIFPTSTSEQETSFKLLKQAYIDARYEKNYQISKTQLDYLLERVQILKTTTHQICQQRIDGL